MNESWINELAGESIVLEPRPDFESDLRARVSDEWNGRPTIAPVVPSRSADHQPRRGWLLGAAAASALLVGGVGFVVLRDGDGSVVTPPATEVPSPTPAPTTPQPDVTPVTDPLVEPAPSVVPNAPATDPSGTDSPPSASSVPTPAGPANLLEAWPAGTEAGDLDAVPRLFPSAPVPGATSVSRTEYAGPASTSGIDTYGQLFVAADGSGLIEILTTVGTELPVDGGGILTTEFDAAAWDRAYFTQSTSGSVNAALTDPGGYVFVSTQGLDESVVADVARSLTRRNDDRPGWDVGFVPPGYVEFGESGVTSGSDRTLSWYGADGRGRLEVQIFTGNPSRARAVFPLPDEPGAPTVATQIGDVTGYVSQTNPDRAVVTWSPEPGVVVLLGYGGPVDEAVTIANSMQALDQTTWEASSEIPTQTGDGCSSLFFC